MKILVTGNGKSASWKIRGQQLGEAIGADVDAEPKKVAGYDCMIMVKRSRNDALYKARAAGVPVVYDVVDAWQSAIGFEATALTSRQWLRDQVKAIQPRAIVASTQHMAEDLAEFKLPVIALPHHARPRLVINPIRPSVQTVGYQGSEKYLGWWRPILEAECVRRRWQFVVNPAELADVDIAIAVRDAIGYPAHHWKSNVKLANAQGSGTPCVLNREKGYMETASGGEMWAEDKPELRLALDALAPYGERLDRSRQLRSGEITLGVVAKTYTDWLCSLKF